MMLAGLDALIATGAEDRGHRHRGGGVTGRNTNDIRNVCDARVEGIGGCDPRDVFDQVILEGKL